MTQNPYLNYYQRMPQIQMPSVLKGYPVSSIDEARAANIDFDGSITFFPDLNNKKIYTKQIQMDGSLAFNVYELKDIVIPPKEEIKQKEYVTRDEFNELLVLLKKTMKKVCTISGFSISLRNAGQG